MNTQNAHLGNSTKFASPSHEKTERENNMSKMVEKYWLQSLARELLPHENRINVCMHCMSPTATSVGIVKSREAKRAHYTGLMVCGSVWVCAVCATRITEERRQELSRALETTGMAFYLVTYTVRHTLRDSLPSMLDRMLSAFRKMKSGKAWQHLISDYGWVGSIKSLEVTHGNNGWHPHQHELVILDQKLSKSAQNGLKSELRHKWRSALNKLGLDASWDVGVDLRGTSQDVENYIAKFGHQPIETGWTITHEIAKQPTKKGKIGGRTPAQLLCDYGNGDIRSGRLWFEYALAFKGKKQLVWSKGLREILAIGLEIDDKAIAESVPDGSEILATLNREEWQAIIRADIKGELLDMAVQLEPEMFRRWLSEKLEKWL